VKQPLLIVGDPFFLARHRPLIDALRKRLGAEAVDELPIQDAAVVAKASYFARALLLGRLWPPTRATVRERLQRFSKEPKTFARKSRLAARRIAQHRPAPGLVLQLFSMSSPVTETSSLPYAYYLDMTMALVRRQWPPWAAFDSETRYEEWIALEGASYRGAERVFTFSEAARRSVIDDYGAQAERVVAVGAAGHYQAARTGERNYGNRSIIFNGSEFERKGGDRVIAAFRLVRERYPDATLTVVAYAGLAPEPGLRPLGNVARADLIELFDTTDVVLAPTRLDALPGFVLEAMSRGVVPVLSDSPPMAEIVVHGSEGYVVSPPSPERLAAFVCDLFADGALLRAFGNAARARVLRDWNWDAVADAMVASLNDAMGASLNDAMGASLTDAMGASPREGAPPDAANPR
jgi:glycogen(starch) synthase